MRILLLVTFMFINAFTYGQSFQMQYNKISANEVQFTTVYKGPSAEIILPARGRIIALAEQTDLNAGGGKIRVGIRVGANDTAPDPATGEAPAAKEYTVRFTYSLLLANQGGSGSVSENWYPTIKDKDVEYNVTSLSPTLGMVIYPYLSNENNSFNFLSTQNATLAIFNHTKEVSTDTSLPITIYTANKFGTPFQDIINITEYINDYFGKKDIQEIVIINTHLVTPGSFVDGGKLFVNITGIGTEKQVKDAIVTAWADSKENLSARLFNMFKDSVFRLAQLTLDGNMFADDATATDPTATDVVATETTPTETTESSNTDLGKIVLVPGVTYYQDLFNKGFEVNTVQNVDVEGIFNNYALLHLAQYNIGAETLLAGIKAYFNDGIAPTPVATPEAPVDPANPDATTENITNTETAEVPAGTATEKVVAETETETKTDTEYVDWAVITQNKLQDPLFDLYTKEIIGKDFVPHLVAKGNLVTRNSFNIPDFSITDSEGATVEVAWNDFKSININIAVTSSYTLDPERLVPQQVYMDSFYTPDTNEQTLRSQILVLAERNKANGEISLRKHLDIVKFTVEAENTFQVATGSTVYVVISHILSNTTGALKPGIKESFFSVDMDGKITYVSTRLRI